LADGPVDPNHQSSCNQVFTSIGQAEVSEYVARAGLLLEGLSFLNTVTLPTSSCSLPWKNSSL
jgi:hypothetical protein